MAKSFLLLFTFLFAFSNNIAHAQDSSRKDLILQLIEMNGILPHHSTTLDRLINGFRADLKEIPDSFWENQKKILHKKYVQSIQPDLVRMYDKHLSKDEIKEVIEIIKGEKLKELSESYVSTSYKAIDYGEDLTINLSRSLSEAIEKSNYLQKNINDIPCESFKTGKYVNITWNAEEVRIEKMENFQISRVGDKYLKFEIKYITECDYRLTLIETDMEDHQSNIGSFVHVYPYYVDHKSIKYKSELDNGFILYGQLLIQE